jgi:hypothetical protein
MKSPNRNTEKIKSGLLRGGVRIQCANCLYFKPENQLYQHHKVGWRCNIECRHRTPVDVARQEEADRLRNEQNRLRIAELNDIRIAGEQGITLAELLQRRAEEAARQAEEAARQAENLRAWNEEQQRISNIKEMYANAQREFKQLTFPKRFLTDRENRRMTRRLYRNFGVSHQDLTDMHVAGVKEERKNYINSWNLYNYYYQESEPLWGDINSHLLTFNQHPPRPIPDFYSDLINKRQVHKDYNNRETQLRIYRKQHRGLYTRGNRADDDNILAERHLISYGWDSINKNINTCMPYTFSPNSIEIHCTALKTLDVGVAVRDRRGNLVPSNYYGHVTLNVIGDMTADDKRKITRLGNDLQRDTGDPLHQCIEKIEKKRFGIEYHYGIFIDPNDPARRWERWWTWTPNGGRDLVNFHLQEFPPYIAEHFITTHNSPKRLMSEYFLHCINTCPEEVVYTPPEQLDQTKLTYKDLTVWGPPKRVY